MRRLTLVPIAETMPCARLSWPDTRLAIVKNFKPSNIVLCRPIGNIRDENYISSAQGSPHELRQSRRPDHACWRLCRTDNQPMGGCGSLTTHRGAAWRLPHRPPVSANNEAFADDYFAPPEGFLASIRDARRYGVLSW